MFMNRNDGSIKSLKSLIAVLRYLYFYSNLTMTTILSKNRCFFLQIMKLIRKQDRGWLQEHH